MEDATDSRKSNRDNLTLISIIEHIDNAIADANQFRNAMELTSNRLVRNSVAMEIIQISELGGDVSPQFIQRHQEIPWAQIRGLRNRLVHEYDEIAWDIIFETVRTDLPQLRANLTAVASIEPDSGDDGDIDVFSKAPRLTD